MIVYKCFVTGDEMFSDSYKMTEVHGVLYEVEAKVTSEKEEEIDESLIGGNKSAEEPDDSATVASGTKIGPNVVLRNRYVETGFGSKKEFLLTMRTYTKAALKFQQELAAKDGKEFDEDAFKAAHQAAMKDFIIPHFDDFQYYTGESVNPDGTIPFLLWKKKDGESDETPFLYYFKAGLSVEKY